MQFEESSKMHVCGLPRVHGYLRKNVENISSGESLFNGVLAWNSYVLGDNNTTK